MAYGATILTNGSAETGTTIGWAVSGGSPVRVSYIPYINDRHGWLSGALDVSLYILGNFPITAVENETSSTRYIPFPDDRDKWGTWEHSLLLYGLAGDYCFQFSAVEDAEMYQILLASDVGAQPITFEFISKFKLLNAQELWDTNVLGMIQLQINYTDATNDYFVIPCVKGATHADRSLINFWVLVTNICAVDATKTLNYVKVVAKTINCVNILNIDYIELRKEV